MRPDPPLRLTDDLAADIAIDEMLTAEIDALILRRHRVRGRIALETRRRELLARDPATARERVDAALAAVSDTNR